MTLYSMLYEEQTVSSLRSVSSSGSTLFAQAGLFQYLGFLWYFQHFVVP